MFEKLKEMVAISDEEMIIAIALDEEANAKRKAGKAKRKAMAELFKTKDEDFVAALVEKKDGTLAGFGESVE